jgi:hypothetical protein
MEYMVHSLFTQNVIAIIWDFDKILTPAYMQAPLFKKFGVDEKSFWDESNALGDFYRARGMSHISHDTLYLNHILTYVRCGKFPGLNNKMLRDIGAQIEFYEGLPRFFPEINTRTEGDEKFNKHGITVEHYVVSTGLREMILGSRINPYIEGVWACEFFEETPDPGYLTHQQPELFTQQRAGIISGLGYVIDNTSKTRALFEISKGSNKHSEIDVNAFLAPEDRRVPFQNMIYIADGPSDIPAFSTVNQFGGRTFAVYKPRKMDQFIQVDKLQKQNRVQGIGEASFVEGSLTSFWITNAVREIADRIVADRQSALRDKVGAVPHHILTDIGEKHKTVGNMEISPEVDTPAKKVPVAETSLSLIDGRQEKAK